MFICRANHVSPRIDAQEARHSTCAPALSGKDSTYAVLADQTGAVSADTAVVVNNELALHLPRSLISISQNPLQLSVPILSLISRELQISRGANTPFAGALAVPAVRRNSSVAISPRFLQRSGSKVDLLAGPGVPNGLVSHLEMSEGGS